MGLIPTCWIGSCSCRLLRSFFFISTFQEMHIFATSPSLMTNFATSATELGKNTNPILGAAQGKYFITWRSYFLGGGDIRTNFILKGLLSYLRCLVIKVHLYQSIPVYFAVEVKTDIQINFSNIKLQNSTYFYKIKKDICLYRPLPMFCKDPQASRSATKSQPPSRAILPPPITSYMHSQFSLGVLYT